MAKYICKENYVMSDTFDIAFHKGRVYEIKKESDNIYRTTSAVGPHELDQEDIDEYFKLAFNAIPKKEMEEVAQKKYPITNQGDFISRFGLNFVAHNAFIEGAEWQNQKTKEILNEVIFLLKQTTEYEVLDSFKEKVKVIETFTEKINDR